jgi:hypothetical protein
MFSPVISWPLADHTGFCRERTPRKDRCTENRSQAERLSFRQRIKGKGIRGGETEFG